VVEKFDELLGRLQEKAVTKGRGRAGEGSQAGLMPLGDILNQALPKPARSQFVQATRRSLTPLSRIQNRLLTPSSDNDQELCFQHSVFCQTGLPYRNPGEEVRLWKRRQGFAALEIEAGRAFDANKDDYVNIGLPWGPKPRLILAHLNAEALRLSSPEIAIDNSLTAFVKRIRGFTTGREIQTFKEQLTRLSNAEIRLAMLQRNRVVQINTHVVTGFELWLPKDERQRVLWPSTVRLSTEYFDSLKQHAVPLNESDLGALAHSAMGLDIYAWLAQRLHRIDPRKPAFIAWVNLKEQFGPDYDRMTDFKRFFRKTLAQVQQRYQSARIELDSRGMTARNSPPPVGRRLTVMSGPILKAIDLTA
jgi:hypothetical protein